MASMTQESTGAGPDEGHSPANMHNSGDNGVITAIGNFRPPRRISHLSGAASDSQPNRRAEKQPLLHRRQETKRTSTPLHCTLAPEDRKRIAANKAKAQALRDAKRALRASPAQTQHRQMPDQSNAARSRSYKPGDSITMGDGRAGFVLRAGPNFVQVDCSCTAIQAREKVGAIQRDSQLIVLDGNCTPLTTADGTARRVAQQNLVDCRQSLAEGFNASLATAVKHGQSQQECSQSQSQQECSQSQSQSESQQPPGEENISLRSVDAKVAANEAGDELHMGTNSSLLTMAPTQQILSPAVASRLRPELTLSVDVLPAADGGGDGGDMALSLFTWGSSRAVTVSAKSVQAGRALFDQQSQTVAVTAVSASAAATRTIKVTGPECPRKRKRMPHLDVVASRKDTNIMTVNSKRPQKQTARRIRIAKRGTDRSGQADRNRQRQAPPQSQRALPSRRRKCTPQAGPTNRCSGTQHLGNALAKKQSAGVDSSDPWDFDL
jgi:hypothetical protein